MSPLRLCAAWCRTEGKSPNGLASRLGSSAASRPRGAQLGSHHQNNYGGAGNRVGPTLRGWEPSQCQRPVREPSLDVSGITTAIGRSPSPAPPLRVQQSDVESFDRLQFAPTQSAVNSTDAPAVLLASSVAATVTGNGSASGIVSASSRRELARELQAITLPCLTRPRPVFASLST